MTVGPTVTIVVPIRNGPHLVDACLRSLAALERPSGLREIIIVDDASSDDTPTAAEAWAGRLPVRVIRGDRQRGPGAARNIGARNAQSEILAFIDGDCIADPRWLADLIPLFEDPTVVAVGGRLISAEERTWIQRYEGVCHPSQRGSDAQDVGPGTSNDFLPGCNMLVRRRPFLALGGFNTGYHLGEDVDMTWRLASIAGRVLYRPDGIVAHHHLERLGALLRRRVALGSSEGILTRRFPAHRRAFAVSLSQLVFFAAVAGAFAWTIWIAVAGVAALAMDLTHALRTARRARIEIGAAGVVRSLARAHSSVAYRALTLIDRYFAIPIAVAAIVAGSFWWPAFLVPGALVATSVGIGVIEWIRLRRPLDGVRFVSVWTLDQWAVHLGILMGCIKHRTLLPLRIRLALAPWTIDLLRYGHSGASVESDPLFAASAATDPSAAEPAIDERGE